MASACLVGILRRCGIDQMIKFKGSEGAWEPVYAKWPKKINGRWYWLTTVYCRERNRVVWPPQGWEYGDGFDVLKDA